MIFFKYRKDCVEAIRVKDALETKGGVLERLSKLEKENIRLNETLKRLVDIVYKDKK